MEILLYFLISAGYARVTYERSKEIITSIVCGLLWPIGFGVVIARKAQNK